MRRAKKKKTTAVWIDHSPYGSFFILLLIMRQHILPLIRPELYDARYSLVSGWRDLSYSRSLFFCTGVRSLGTWICTVT